MARIAPPSRRPLLVRLVQWFAGRQLGKVPTPMQVTAHAPRVFMSHARMEMAQMKARRAPARIVKLAQVRAATLIGCPF